MSSSPSASPSSAGWGATASIAATRLRWAASSPSRRRCASCSAAIAATAASAEPSDARVRGPRAGPVDLPAGERAGQAGTLAIVRRIVRGSLLGSQCRIHLVDPGAGRACTHLQIRRLTCEHLLPAEDPILWVADAFAWVAGAGGDWAAGRCDDALRVVDIQP